MISNDWGIYCENITIKCFTDVILGVRYGSGDTVSRFIETLQRAARKGYGGHLQIRQKADTTFLVGRVNADYSVVLALHPLDGPKLYRVNSEQITIEPIDLLFSPTRLRAATVSKPKCQCESTLAPRNKETLVKGKDGESWLIPSDWLTH